MLHTRPTRRIALRLLLGSAVLTLAACGRKGSPLPPPDVDPCFPRHYPMDETAKEACAKKVIQARQDREEKLEKEQQQKQRQQQKGQPQAAPQAAPATPAPAAPDAAPSNPATPSPATPSQPQ
jgi:hypothetical protein